MSEIIRTETKQVGRCKVHGSIVTGYDEPIVTAFVTLPGGRTVHLITRHASDPDRDLADAMHAATLSAIAVDLEIEQAERLTEARVLEDVRRRLEEEGRDADTSLPAMAGAYPANGGQYS